jgi:hypothetical protein
MEQRMKNFSGSTGRVRRSRSSSPVDGIRGTLRSSITTFKNRRCAMYARVLTFSGVNDIDAGVRFMQETAQPLVRSQRGYQGMTASADRSAGILGVLALWETEADRDASESALGKTREEARGLLGAELTVATLEEMAVEVGRAPQVGSPLMLTRISMDPARIDENVGRLPRPWPAARKPAAAASPSATPPTARSSSSISSKGFGPAEPSPS